MTRLGKFRLVKAACAGGACAGVAWIALAFTDTRVKYPEWLFAAACTVVAVLIAFALLVLDPAIARAAGRKGRS